MINLFEYQNKAAFSGDSDDLEAFLDEIWQKRDKTSGYYQNDQLQIESQRFLQFIHKSNEIKSNKYVGVIRFGEQRINLLPKVFYASEKKLSTNEVNNIHLHIVWWLSYCRKIKFPNYLSSLGSKETDFFEVLIYLFSKYTRDLLGSIVFQQYQEVSQEQVFIKGRLDSGTYFRQNLATGKWHKFSCSYDSFVVDNEFNRIVKYVSTMLFNASTSQDNRKNLREILFILDEVSDVRASADQCARIQFNPMFEQFSTVRDYCHLFLSNSISFDYKNDLKLFAFLLPMEYVFEDFVYGFIERELPEIAVKSQRGDTFLDVGRTFGLKPDLFLTTSSGNVIADTKYKLVYAYESDPKNGISQQDLYQVVSYAIRFNVDNVYLFYPEIVSKNLQPPTKLRVNDELADGLPIQITIVQLPLINRELIDVDESRYTNISDLFSSTRSRLLHVIEKNLS